jgi:hypothetical protein
LKGRAPGEAGAGSRQVGGGHILVKHFSYICR